MFRAFSIPMTGFAVWAAYLQLNDPDPERWTAMYLACAGIALLATLGRPAPRLALLVASIAGTWALAILPELVGKWKPSDLSAEMTESRPEIEYGREFGGLVIVTSYCAAAFAVFRHAVRGGARRLEGAP